MLLPMLLSTGPVAVPDSAEPNALVTSAVFRREGCYYYYCIVFSYVEICYSKLPILST